MDTLRDAIVRDVENDIHDIVSDPQWIKFKNALVASGLEPAFDEFNNQPRDDVYKKIISTVWQEVSRPDGLVHALTVRDPRTLALTRLFQYLFQSDHTTVTVVTTNYDRLVEYAAGAAQYMYRTGFNPGYAGRWRSSHQGTLHFFRVNPIVRQAERTVEIWKVHGSLDWFRHPGSQSIVSIPLEANPPSDLVPLIVLPSRTKYQETHEEPFRTILTAADNALVGGRGFLCIGYGFNDDHIHPKLVERVKIGRTPIIILAKKLTEKTRAFLTDSPEVHFVAMEEVENYGTRIYTHDNPLGIEIEAIHYWDIRNFVTGVI